MAYYFRQGRLLLSVLRSISVYSWPSSHIFTTFVFMCCSGTYILKRSTSRNIDSLLFKLLDISSDRSSGTAEKDRQILSRKKTVLIYSLARHAKNLMLS